MRLSPVASEKKKPPRRCRSPARAICKQQMALKQRVSPEILSRPPSKLTNDDGTMTTVTSRPHAATEALKRLADKRSTRLKRPLVDALFVIGLKGEADASSAEWALIDLADLLLGENKR
jgi:hypothetical protein